MPRLSHATSPTNVISIETHGIRASHSGRLSAGAQGSALGELSCFTIKPTSDAREELEMHFKFIEPTPIIG